LCITREKVYFQSAYLKTGFNLEISQIKQVSEDTLGDIGNIFKKKKNRVPILIIRDWNKNRYSIRLRPGEKKLRGFIEFILDTLKAGK